MHDVIPVEHSNTQVSAHERLLLPPNIGGGLLRTAIVPLERLISHPSQLTPLLKE